MVAYLLTLDETAFSNYLQAIEQVLLTIEPPTYREHNALPVLMGRPLALAQVHLTAEIKGLPAVDQSYETLTNLIDQQPKRESAPADSLRTWHNFTAVELPLRLGDIVTERDGLVCAFSRNDDAFTAHQLEVDANGHHDRDDADDLWLSLSTRSEDVEYYEIKKGDTLKAISKEFYNNGAKYTKIFEANRELIKDPDLIFPGQKIRIPDANEVTVPLLLDPRAKIHATTGFLPVQSLAIPPEFYNQVLQRMALTFLVNPILSVDTPLTLPLPAETTHTWAWYDPQHGWDAALAPSDDRAHLDTVTQQIREGWLRMRPYDNDKQA
jgi:LysM repeat protein